MRLIIFLFLLILPKMSPALILEPLKEDMDYPSRKVDCKLNNKSFGLNLNDGSRKASSLCESHGGIKRIYYSGTVESSSKLMQAEPQKDDGVLWYNSTLKEASIDSQLKTSP
jgi:hypothetical protein